LVIGIGWRPNGLVREEVLNIYIGNLSSSTKESDLEAAFANYGTVTSTFISVDRETQRTRGFGFIEMKNQLEAAAAISGLNGKDLGGSLVTVNEARPRGGERGGAKHRPAGTRW
jgi:RNA recognition motif-containing protein